MTVLVGTNEGATFELDGFTLDGELSLAILEAAEGTGPNEMAVAGLQPAGEATDGLEGAILVALDVLETAGEAKLGLEGTSLGVTETVEETTLALEE